MKMALGETFNGPLGADRHKDGGRDIAVGGVENSGAGPGFGTFREEFKGDLAGQVFILGR